MLTPAARETLTDSTRKLRCASTLSVVFGRNTCTQNRPLKARGYRRSAVLGMGKYNL